MSVKVYTKKGDKGKSSTLKDFQKPKSDLVFEIVGTFDELNAFLGILYSSKKPELKKEVKIIQDDLFTLASFFAGVKFETKDNVWLTKRIEQMEKSIDLIDSKNKPLKNFILPGGTFESINLHVCRAICRRLERLVSAKKTNKDFNLVQVYLNRLSDYLFVLARKYNNFGKKDILWLAKK